MFSPVGCGRFRRLLHQFSQRGTEVAQHHLDFGLVGPGPGEVGHKVITGNGGPMWWGLHSQLLGQGCLKHRSRERKSGRGLKGGKAKHVQLCCGLVRNGHSQLQTPLDGFRQVTADQLSGGNAHVQASGSFRLTKSTRADMSTDSSF